MSRVIDQNTYDPAKSRRDFQSVVESWPHQLLTVPVIEPDTRTPEIEAEVSELQGTIGDNTTVIAAESDSLELMQEQYQQALMTDRPQAMRLAADSQVSRDIIASLEKEQTRKRARVAELTREKQTIAGARQRVQNEITVAEAVNEAKRAAAASLAAIRAGLLDLRTHGQRLDDLSRANISSTNAAEVGIDRMQQGIDKIFEDLRLTNEMTRDSFVRRRVL